MAGTLSSLLLLKVKPRDQCNSFVFWELVRNVESHTHPDPLTQDPILTFPQVILCTSKFEKHRPRAALSSPIWERKH